MVMLQTYLILRQESRTQCGDAQNASSHGVSLQTFLYAILMGVGGSGIDSPTLQEEGMPGPSVHALTWSEVQQHYELTTRGQPEHCFRPGDESAWHHWLDEHTAFAFAGKSGRISVLKEAHSRGAGYWYAYRTKARQTRKHYLGPTAKVTFDHLEEVSNRLTSESPS